MTREENIQRFEEITSGITREGITELMAYIKKSDFYASYHKVALIQLHKREY